MSEDNSDCNQRVLVPATTYPRWDGDTVPRFVEDLSIQLNQHGIKQIVLAPHHPDAERHDEREGIKVIRYPYFFPKRYQCLCYDGGILESIKNSRLALLQAPLLALSLLLHTFWIVYKEDIDIVHSHWLVPNGVAASLLKPIFNYNHVLTLHAGGVHGVGQLPFSSLLASYVYRNSDVIVPVSTHIRDTFAQMASVQADENTKFRIQPMGADTQNYGQYNAKEAKAELNYSNSCVGLFVGRLAEKKGLSYLVDAMERLAQNDVDFKLVIVGTGPLEEDLRQQIADSPAKDIIEVVGWIEEEDLVRYYCAADFLVVPSIEADSGDTEGMPTVIAEAFAASTPVVASDVGGISDIVEPHENGLLVEQRSSEELAEAIHKLIQDRDLRTRLANGALKTSEELDWERCGETYAEILTLVGEE